MTFGKRMRNCRKALGLTQKELADKCGVSRRTIMLYESDRNDPLLFNAMCIATVLGVTLDFLARGV